MAVIDFHNNHLIFTAPCILHATIWASNVFRMPDLYGRQFTHAVMHVEDQATDHGQICERKEEDERLFHRRNKTTTDSEKCPV